MVPSPSRLRLDGDALVANWRLLARMSGTAACGAAIKADGYGLGAPEVLARLAAAGCRDFFVATWNEALAVAAAARVHDVAVSVLHGVRAEDMTVATQGFARPVLNSAEQVARWREAGGGRCDVMVDTGMNRLGVSAAQIASGLLDGLRIETLMSHLACADEDSAMNRAQRTAFAALAGRTGARRMSLANSAGIALGADYAFDLTRPGLALYGGVPREELAEIAQVAWPEAQVLQRRIVPVGEVVGYNALWRAGVDTPVAIVNLGYADGYFRGFSGVGMAYAGDAVLPVVGRVSMDLVALDASAAPDLGEGDWVRFDFALPQASAASGMSQYELLTSFGRRYTRLWA
jgi:alanine racemase